MTTSHSTVTVAAASPDLHAEAWAFVLRHQPMIYRLSRKFGGAIEDRGDFYQSVIVRLVERYPAYDAKRSAPCTWISWQIRAVVTNYTRKFHQRVREGVGQDVSKDGELRTIPAPTGTYGTEEHVCRLEGHQDALALVGDMYERATPRQRIAVRAYLSGMSSRELRARHGMTITQRDRHLREMGMAYEETTP